MFLKRYFQIRATVSINCSVESKICLVPVQSAPEHQKWPEKCSGAAKNAQKVLRSRQKMAFLLRSRQVFQNVLRSSGCQFPTLRAPCAAVGGTIWLAWPMGPTLHWWAGPKAHRPATVVCVPKFAFNTAPPAGHSRAPYGWLPVHAAICGPRASGSIVDRP